MKARLLFILFILCCMGQAFADSNQALLAVKNFSCIVGGTLESYFIQKTATPGNQDLGWSAVPDQNGYVVEKALQIGNRGSQAIYRWRVNPSGTVNAINDYAIGITKKPSEAGIPSVPQFDRDFAYSGKSTYSSPSYSFSSGSKDVRVKGYYRKDGTYVRPHYRNRPSPR